MELHVGRVLADIGKADDLAPRNVLAGEGNDRNRRVLQLFLALSSRDGDLFDTVLFIARRVRRGSLGRFYEQPRKPCGKRQQRDVVLPHDETLCLILHGLSPPSLILLLGID